MYWTSKLARFCGVEKAPKLPERFSADSAGEVIGRILAENPAIAGDESIIAQLIARGEIRYFRRGDTLIQEGAQEDHVFFLLSGRVDIRFRAQLGSIREAPNQVGELAAIKPGSARSATVVAKTEEVAALRVGGHVFYQIYTTNHGFRQRLDVGMNERFRERIVAGQVAKQNSFFTWLMVSLAAAAAVAIVTWFATGGLGWTDTTHVLTTLFSFISSFMIVFLLNPVFFWRKLFSLAFLSMVGTYWLGNYVSFEMEDGFRIILGASVEGDSIEETIVKAVSLIIVMVICAIRDHTVTRES
jgi:CRP-like cAMP-binding protein